MSEERESRREALKIIGAIGSTCAFPFSADELYGQEAHHAAHAAAARAAEMPEPKFFSKDEFAVVSRIADLIIPETDTPGALGAGVPVYIDMVVDSGKTHRKTYRDGLKWLAGHAREKYGKGFLELEEDRQVEILTALSDAMEKGRSNASVRFFRAIKSMTADGYYTSKVGLMQELGYAGNTVLGEFPECTHEH